MDSPDDQLTPRGLRWLGFANLTIAAASAYVCSRTNSFSEATVITIVAFVVTGCGYLRRNFWFGWLAGNVVSLYPFLNALWALSHVGLEGLTMQIPAMAYAAIAFYILDVRYRSQFFNQKQQPAASRKVVLVPKGPRRAPQDDPE